MSWVVYQKGIRSPLVDHCSDRFVRNCCRIVWCNVSHSKLLNLYNPVALKLTFKLSIQTLIPFGAPPPAPCKERFLLTILSSRRIRLYPDNGSHYAARKTIRPGATSQSIHISCIAPGQGFALKAAE